MEKVTIVIPVKNERKTIQKLLDSISRQTFPPTEVVIIDGGSRDRTKDIIRENMGRAPFPIRLIETEQAYPGEGRNLGINEAKTDLIAFTDAGITLNEKWIEELLKPIREDESVAVVYGAYEPVIDSFMKDCALIAFVPPRVKRNGITMRTDFIASSLFKHYVFDAAGRFPNFRAAEDKIFMENVKKIGVRIAYAEKAVAYWDIPGSITGIFRRFFTFSVHDLVAGRAKDWHDSVFRTYILIEILFIAGLIVNPMYMIGIPLIWFVRMANIYRKKFRDLRLRHVFNPFYFLMINFIVFITDMAMFFGGVLYFLRYHPSRQTPGLQPKGWKRFGRSGSESHRGLH